MQKQTDPHVAVLLDGRRRASELRATLVTRVQALQASGINPCLGIVIVGDDPASHAYVQTITRTAKQLGIAVFLEVLPVEATSDEVNAVIVQLNADASIHGLVLQQPLPPHIHSEIVAQHIAPEKDVDGANPTTQGHVALGSRTFFTPATPRAVMELLEVSPAWPLRGKRAVVIGKSSVVGLPVALLMLHEGATVTVTHKDTQDLAGYLRDAEVVVSAAGVPGLVQGHMLRPGVTIVDVGTTVVGDELLGDVDFASASAVAAALTPVPGGVGPVTTATLLANVVDASERWSAQFVLKNLPK